MSPRIAAVALALAVLASPALAQVKLSVADLYAGFDARKVLPSPDGQKLVLSDRAVAAKGGTGWVVTDPIDLGPSAGLIALPAELTAVKLEVQAELPETTSAVVEFRSSADQKSWSDWQKLDGLTATVDKPAGRFVQVKVTLKAAAKDKLPALLGMTLTPTLANVAKLDNVTVVESNIQKIVRSPIEFVYERPDQAKLAKFRKEAKLDEVVAGAKDDFEKLVKLMDWVGSCKNIRGTRKETTGGCYQWDIDAVFGIVDGQPSIYGHCMSYSEVLTTAATAMGYVGSRHMCMVGFREASHEVCDIWVPSLGKWVYFDPSLTNYYFDKQTKTPMNLIEMHLLVADKFVPAGKDMRWFMQRNNDETKQVVRTVGGQAHIGSRLGPSKYGDPMPADYDWGWYHGYLAAGFVQMTPRNDFHSNPKANPRRFGNNPGYANHPVWVDAKTPPLTGNWYTRLRDFYWTLDQATLRLTAAGEGKLHVDLDNSMPFFKSYKVTVDGKDVASDGGQMLWQLHGGANKLTVAPVDEFGKVGLPSSVTVNYAK